MTNNHHGLVANVRASASDTTAERDAAALMLADVADSGKRLTVGAAKAYDTTGFAEACREGKVAAHGAQNTNSNGCSTINSRTTHHPGYKVIQPKRKRSDQRFA